MSERLTHLDQSGAANMVDVGQKPDSARVALASASITMAEATLSAILAGNAKKGDVLAAARLAGIMAAKKTPELIPLCHPLRLSQVSVDLFPRPGQGRIDIEALAKTTGPTGVEMEALTAAAVAALTIYDMAKALDRSMLIGDIKLLKKDGGRSGLYLRPPSRP
ncbi:MAG: cyclic pyranopterin monophosphate synthase MoaC [Candidatus Adiutrix sp.]|jgi:cyclic pyranopterin phosphate synthase|nr:cyclic pyranopterin monophosphate synthase MoaC [Candidatus Adiutrix sp.]